MNNKQLSQFTNEAPGRVSTDTESLYSTRSWKEIDTTREQALTDYMAGVTNRLDPLPTQKSYTKLNNNVFEEYNNAMSQVSLYDPNTSKTLKTYTDYTAQGGMPIPGYEAMDEDFKQIDRMHTLQTQVEEGQMTEDQMLWDLYGLDILETQGYKIRSVGWWQSKYQNNDFANPLENKYLVSTVLDSAREHHNSLLAKEYAHKKQVNDSAMASLLSKGDLTNQQIKELFPELTSAIDSISTEEDYEWWVTTNNVPFNMRIYQTDTGERYYLHTDGELYKLSNTESGQNIASYKEDQNGNMIEISLNKSDALDVLQEFKAGAASTLTTLEKLVAATVGFVWGLVPGGDNPIESLTAFTDSVDAYNNDHWAWAVDSGRIDLDGFQLDSFKDWACFLSRTGGSIAAGHYLGGLAKGVAVWGDKLAASDNALKSVVGTVAKFGGNLYARSTGLYKGYTGEKTALELVGWGPTFAHLRTVAVYAAKDFNNNVQSMYSQKIRYKLENPDAEISKDDDFKIFAVSAGNAMFNAFVSTILAGGVDDDQVNRWLQVVGNDGSTAPQHVEALEHLNLYQFLVKYRAPINGIAEGLDNIITMYTGSAINWEADASMWEMATKNFNWETFAQSAVKGLITAAPSMWSQFKRRNVAYENSQAIWRAVMNEIDEKATTPEQKIAADNIKADALRVFEETKGNNTDKVFGALNYLHEHLAGDPNVDQTIVTKTLDKVCKDKYRLVLSDMNNANVDWWNREYARWKDNQNTMAAEGVKAGLKKAVKNFVSSKRLKNQPFQIDKRTGMMHGITPTIEATMNEMYNYYIQQTMMKYSEENADYLRNALNTTVEKLQGVKDINYGYEELIRNHKDKAEAADKAAEAKAKELGIEKADAVKQATKYYTLKLESGDRGYLSSNQAAMVFIEKVMPYFYKVDDNTYGLLGVNKEMTNIFNNDFIEKNVLAMHAMNTKDPNTAEVGMNLFINTFFGDDYDLSKISKKDGKDLINNWLQIAIDNNVISTLDAAQILVQIKQNPNTEIGKQMVDFFDTDLTLAASNNPDMTDLEKYALTFNAVMHLQQPNNKRFSTKTVISQKILNEDDPIHQKILDDLVKANLASEGIQQQYYTNLKDKTGKQVFSLAADRFVKDTLEVIGQAGIKLPDSEEGIIKALKHVANVDDESLASKAKQILSFIEDTKDFESVRFDGDTITFDYSSYMTKKVLDFIKEVSREGDGTVVSKKQKGTYASLKAMNEDEAKKYLTTATNLVNEEHPIFSIKVEDMTEEDVTKFYTIMHDAGMFTDMGDTPPKDAEEFRKYILNYTTELGDEFAKINRGTKYDTKIIKEEDRKLIAEKSRKVNFDRTLAKFRELHPEEGYVAEYNYYDLMLNNLDINKISSDMSKNRYRGTESNIVINPVKFGTDKNGATIYIKYPKSVEEKTGRVSNEAGEKHASIANDAQAAQVNKDMSIKFSLLHLVDQMYALPAIDVVIPQDQYIELCDKGLINPLGTKGDAFFDTVYTPTTWDKNGYIRLQLSKDKDLMKEYIETNKEINLYRILPFYSNEKANTSISFNTPANLDMPDVKGKGLTTYDNIYNLINTTFDYDKSGKLKAQLWKEFFAAHDSLEYNPFSSSNINLDINKVKEYILTHPDYYGEQPETISDIDAYNLYRNGTHFENIDGSETEVANAPQAGLDDSYYALLDLYDQLEKSYIDDETNDDAKIWLTEPNVLKRVVTAVKNNEEYTPDLEKELIKTYHDASHGRKLSPYESIYNTPVSNYIVGNSYGVPSNTYIDTAISKRLLDFDTDTHYRLTFEDGSTVQSPDVVSEQLHDAYDYIKNNITKFDETNDIINSTLNNYEENFRIYVPDDIIKLHVTLGAADDRILIEDLDTLSRIEAEKYRIYFDEILGMGEGYGENLRNKIINTKKNLLKYTDQESFAPTINKRQMMLDQINPYTSTARIDFRQTLLGRGEHSNNRVNNYVNSYFRNNEEDQDLLADPVRLIDGIGEMNKKFTNEYLQKYADSDDKFEKANLEYLGKVAVEDNADVKGSTLVGDISSAMGQARMISSARNTYDSFKNINYSLGIPINETEDNVVKYVTDLVYRSTGIDYLGSWAKYSFYDPETGTEVTNAMYDNEVGDLDLLDVALTDDKKLIGKVFVSLDKHKVGSSDGLDFHYTYIKDENSLANLKAMALLNVVEKNKTLLKDSYSGAEDALIKMSNNDINAFLQLVKKTNTPKYAKTRYLLNLLDETNVDNKAIAIMQPQNWKNDSIKNLIADQLGEATPARFDKDPQVRIMKDAINFGISEEAMSDLHRNLKNQAIESLIYQLKPELGDTPINESLVKDYVTTINNRELLQPEWAALRKAYGIKDEYETKEQKDKAYRNMIVRYICDTSDQPETLSYLFNKQKSLLNMYKEMLNPNRETYRAYNGQEISINDLNNFFTDGSESTLQKVTGMDCETRNKKYDEDGNVAHDIRDVFQVSFKVYTKDEQNNLQVETITKFIKHDDTASEWVRKNISTSDPFFRGTKSYRDALAKYVTTNESDMWTEQQLADFLSGRTSSKADLIIAYNGENFEFKVFEKELRGLTCLDAIKTVLKDYGDTTQRVSLQDVYKRSISSDYGEKHNAEDDTNDMMDLVIKMINTDTYMEKDRYRLIDNLRNLVGDDEAFESLLYKANAFINKNEVLETNRKQFKNYNPSLDEIKQLQRAYNYLQNNKDGKMIFELMDQLDTVSSRAQLVKRNSEMARNMVDILAIKMIETEGDFEAARSKIFNVAYNELNASSSDEVYKLIGEKNEDLLTKAGIDFEQLDTDKAKEYKKEIISAFSTGVEGLKNNRFVTDVSEIADYEKHFGDVGYLVASQNIIKNALPDLPQRSRNILVNILSNGMISIDEDMNVEDLRDALNHTLVYNQAGVDQYEKEVQNILDKNIGTGTFRGIYQMSVGIDPNRNEMKELVYNVDGTVETKDTLDDVRPLEMVMSVGTLRDKFKIKDIESIRGSDGNLYLVSITNPADNLNPILPLRVRLVQGNGQFIGFTPETQEILRSRDFDGDHSLTTTLNSKAAMEVATAINKYMQAPLNIITKMGAEYKSKLDLTKSSREKTFINFVGLQNEEVIKVCKEMDSFLQKHSGELTLGKEAKAEEKILNDKLRNVLRDTIRNNPDEAIFNLNIIPDSAEADNLIDKTVKTLGVQETFTNTSDTFRFVGNPAVWKEGTYSYNQRLNTLARLQLEGTNKGDSTAGSHQKLMALMNSEPIPINNPMKDLFTPTLYLPDDIITNIEATVKTPDSFKTFTKNLKTFALEGFNNDAFTERTINQYEKYLDNYIAQCRIDVSGMNSKQLASKAVQMLSNVVWDTEMYIQNSMESQEAFNKALDELSHDDTFRKNLNTTLDLEARIKKLNAKNKTIRSKNLQYNPTQDLLSQDIITNRTRALNGDIDAFNYGKALYTSEDRMEQMLNERLDGDNLVNVIMVAGYTPDPDTIGVTPWSKASNLQITYFDKRKANYYDLDKITSKKDPNKINKGTVIGTTLDGKEKIVARDDFYISKQDENFIYGNYSEPIVGKKISCLGLAKGNSKTMSIELENRDSSDVDLIIDINNAFKNPKKLPIGFDRDKLFKNAEVVKYYVGDGDNRQLKTGYLFKGIPANILGASSNYEPRVDTSDPSSIRRYELMTLDTAHTLTNIGRFGDMVLRTAPDGQLYVDTSELKGIARKSYLGDYSSCYNDIAAELMFQRSDVLVNELTDEEFLGIMSKNYKGEPPFKTKDEYLDNLAASREKVDSEAAYNEQLDIIHYLGKDRYKNLVNRNNYYKMLFGGLMNQELNKLLPDSFTESFFENPRTAPSKSSATYGFDTSEKKMIGGKVINETQREARPRQIRSNLFLHMPADVWYQQLTGYKPKTNSLINFILDGKMEVARHYKDSADQENNYYPIGVEMGLEVPTELYNNVIANNPKSSFATTQDERYLRNLNAGKWTAGLEDDHPVVNIRNDPHKSTVYNMFNDLKEDSRITTGYSGNTRFCHDLALALDNSKNNIEKWSYLKGIDSVLINRMNYQMVNDNDQMYYRGVIKSNEVPIKDAFKTVNDNVEGYTLKKDLEGYIKDNQLDNKTLNYMKDTIAKVNEDNIKANEENETRKQAYNKINSMLHIPQSEYDGMNIKATWDVSENSTPWKINHWTRSGIDDRGIDQLAADVGIKNYKAGIEYTTLLYSENLNKLKAQMTTVNKQDWENFCKYEFITAAEEVKNQAQMNTLMKVMNVQNVADLKMMHDSFAQNNPELVRTWNAHIDSVMDLAEQASIITGDPFTRSYVFMMPFVSTDKTLREGQIYSTIKSMASISKYDPTSHSNILKQNLAFNFFEGSERLIKDLSSVVNARHISDAMLGKYTGKAMIDNKPILDEAFKIIDETNAIESLKPYTSFDSEITNKVVDIVASFTDLDIKRIRKHSVDAPDMLKNVFTSIRDDVGYFRDLLYPVDEDGVAPEYPTLTEAYRFARGDLSNSLDPETKANYESLYNYMYAEILVAQRIIESDKYASSKLDKYLDSLSKNGYVLVNKFCQKIERNGEIAPIDQASFGYLKDNLELTFNSQSKTMFNQYILEKALSGEIYLAPKDLADVFEKQVYTAKVPSRIRKLITDASRTCAGIQMALPAKIAGRLMRFTGTDYSFGIVSNPNVASYIPIAGKELSAYVMSQGHNISDDLRDYMEREGQPNVWGSGRDPLDPNITLNGITSKLTTPFDIQNHLGRYAIYLAAKKSFDEGNPWYGSQYYNHKAIDALENNQDKAMYVMDYMLGSPGGFPELSKHTSGYLMYATFPMNYMRTLGSYCMSLGKLFQEGITENNATQWYNNVVTPSLGMAGLAILSNLVISAVCEHYGVSEEKEKEWKEEGVTLDPLGTLIGGTPSVVYDSTNPFYLGKEMFINPFTNEHNTNVLQKGYGWLKANILSKLNPLIKTPIELVTGQDIWGDSAEGYKKAQGLFEEKNTYQYTNIENGLKKVFGILLGSGMADAMVDQFKMDQYDDSSNILSTLKKGFTKGFAADLGNQKSWKKDTSNYYAILTDMKSYSKTAKDVYGNTYGNTYYYSIEDMADADKLERSRKYSGRYGEFNKDDYNRVNSMIKKMIENHTSATTLYTYIVKEFNEKGVSEATMRAALNSNSIVRKLRQDSMSGYRDTLNESELSRLEQAIAYENEYYPILQLLFPEKSGGKKYLPNYQRIYNGSGGSSSPSSPYRYYPRTSYPGRKYYPGKYYPSTYKFNKKTGKYSWDWRRVKVNVSPQMAIWNQDKNLTQYDTGMSKKNDPKWLRSRDYVSRVYNI